MSKSSIPGALEELRSFVARAQNALQALEELERDGVIPPRTVVIPRPVVTSPPPAASRRRKKQKSAGANQERICSKCLQSKPLDSFPSRRGKCKECLREYARSWYRKDQDKKQSAKTDNPVPELKYYCKVCRAKFLTRDSLADHNCLAAM